ncbi:MAG: hypothetical protein M1837_003509 [Sclerophora amabilis]|nr:MAG: hypothetical protein M1837_003509 [Sclerophora amabilis]
MSVESVGHDASAPDPRLEAAISALQNQVSQQESDLGQLTGKLEAFPSSPSTDPRERLRQLRSIKSAYENVNSAKPALPAPGSPLPSLIALRSTHRLNAETKTSLVLTKTRLAEVTKRLNKEEADFQDAGLITHELETRIEQLRARQQDHTEITPEATGAGLAQDLKKQKAGYQKDTKRLADALENFIEEHLAAMLAAEELGGPVVGNMIEIDDAALETGFSQQGKLRKLRGSINDVTKQRRIDEIWGPRTPDDSDADLERSEKDAAGREFRSLMEELLRASGNAGSTTSHGAYVQLTRESAAARFLVRAKVAQFHPKDAKRLRLIDFARDLED